MKTNDIVKLNAASVGRKTGNTHMSPARSAQVRPGTIVSHTVPWPRVSLTGFLRLAVNAPRIYWDSEKVSPGLAGCGIAARLTAYGPDRVGSIRRQTASLLENVIVSNEAAPTGIGPRLFGGFSFRSDHRAQGFWSAFPGAYFILPRYQLARLDDQQWLTINYPLEPDDDPTNLSRRLNNEARALLQRLEQSGRANGAVQPNGALPQPAPPVEFKDVMSADTWMGLVSDATRRIKHGDLEKVVLARARQMRSSAPVDAVDVLTRLERTYPNCYRFLFEPVPGHAFYGATPELLAEVTGSALHTVALAGSIRRGSTPEEDEALGQKLLTTPKERHEHALVVDAVTENLQALATVLNVSSRPGLCALRNIQHIQTVIQGRLADDCGILPVVEALHPTPALGGRPRQTALDLIQQLEPISRGWYGAPIGWLDHQGDGIFAVAIRSALSVGNESLLYAGAGIVADSEPEREWRETQLKFRPLVDALGGASSG
jgi:menaquinone-specific isochorismate synthase